MVADLIERERLQPFLVAVSSWIDYTFDELDLDAIRAGAFRGTPEAEETHFDYSLDGTTGRADLHFTWHQDDEVLRIEIVADEELELRARGALDVLNVIDR